MPEAREPRRPLSRGEWLALALAGVAAVALAALWLRSRSPEVPSPPALAPAGEPVAAPPGAAGAPAAEAAVQVDPAQVRALLEPVSPDPLFRRALGHEDLVRRWAIVTDNLAEGVSPRRALSFLAPDRPFSAVDRGGALAIAPESFARYDAFAAAVASVDADAAVTAYRLLHPALEAAYRLLGYPEGSLDGVTARALHRLAAAPVPEGEVLVVPAREGVGYALADPALEALGPVEKHLLRMGPRNAHRVQAKARELEQALGLPAPGAAPAR